jgi:predicted DCC family thiol-disulfide oxidoreductase YuxK
MFANNTTRTPEQLFVLYDASCGLCSSFRTWLQGQHMQTPLNLVPLQSPTLEQQFIGIRAHHPEKEILVVDERGALYKGPAAWVMCLWALTEYRGLAFRLASPELLPFVQKVCTLLSSNRLTLSKILGLKNDLLRNEATELTGACDDGVCRV